MEINELDENLTNLKCIIFDFDKTMYSGGNFNNEDDFWIDFLTINNINDISKDELYEKYPGYHLLQCVCAYAREKGLDDAKLIEYYNNKIFDFIDDTLRTVNPKFIDELSKYYTLYLLSDSSQEYINFYLKKFNINKNNFKECISNRYNMNDMSKAPEMKKVLSDNNFTPKEVLMVGDSYNYDIIPAKKVGLNTFLVKDITDTEYIMQKLLNAKK